MNPKPQMLEGYVIEDDGKRWVMTLRENQWFHDGEKVLARDCTASLRRWMKRDPGGATLEARLDALEAPDDRTIVLRLNKKFPALPKLLSKFQTAAVMVPERIANGTDPFKQMTEIDRQRSVPLPGGRIRDRQPRRAGAVRALRAARRTGELHLGRPSRAGGPRGVEDDPRSPPPAANALVTGEVDWLEMPMPDLLPMLQRAPNVVTGRLDQWGFISQLRPNHVTAPTSNEKLRRAIMAAIDQRDVMQAMMGGDPDGVITPMGYLATGNPAVDMAGIEALTKRRSTADVKAMLDDAGYHGERLVMLHTTDQPFYNSASLVVADALSRVGMQIDDQAMDWGTVLQRRSSQQPLDKGGWSLFVSVTPVPEYRDPLLGSLLRGNGKDAWIGWPEIPRIEAAYNAWLDTDDPAEQTRLEREIQLAAFESVPFIPLGRYMPRAAWSRGISDPLKGPAPVFWNVSKS